MHLETLQQRRTCIVFVIGFVGIVCIMNLSIESEEIADEATADWVKSSCSSYFEYVNIIFDEAYVPKIYSRVMAFPVFICSIQPL